MDEEWTVYEELLVKYLMENKKREIQDILDGAAPKSVYIFGQDLLNLDVQQFCKAMNDPMAYVERLLPRRRALDPRNIVLRSLVGRRRRRYRWKCYAGH